MPDPKPPDGYIETCLSSLVELGTEAGVIIAGVERARAEVAELREDARKYREGTTTPLRDRAMIPMMIIRADRLSEITSDAEKWQEHEVQRKLAESDNPIYSRAYNTRKDNDDGTD